MIAFVYRKQITSTMVQDGMRDYGDHIEHVVMGGSTMGKRFHVILLFDEPGTTDSDTMNAREIDWINSQLLTRLAPGGVLVKVWEHRIDHHL